MLANWLNSRPSSDGPALSGRPPYLFFPALHTAKERPSSFPGRALSSLKTDYWKLVTVVLRAGLQMHNLHICPTHKPIKTANQQQRRPCVGHGAGINTLRTAPTTVAAYFIASDLQSSVPC